MMARQPDTTAPDHFRKTGFSANLLAALFVALLASVTARAEVSVVTFEIEGLISPASPRALTSELEAALDVKVVDLNLKNTESGWPVLSVEFDSGKLSANDIATAISGIEDPAGHKFQVHTGPPTANVEYLDEEIAAMAKLGPLPPAIVPLTNPNPPTAESIAQGKTLFEASCTTCHGLDGGGHGPAAHGITTFPRQLWVWNNAPESADGYLFWFITNGRNEMPPWGVILSESQRWDLVNYIKTLEKPER